MDEIERIRLAYEKRDADLAYRARYTYTNPLNLFSIQQHERALLLALAELGITELRDQRVLDVGCGTGAGLRNFLRYGARPENLTGVDLMPHRIEQARRDLPTEVQLIAQDAQSLPLRDQSFDVVCQFVVFSSILDSDIRRRVAAEMLRCLKPTGTIVWWDMLPIPSPIRAYHRIIARLRSVRRITRHPDLLWRKLRNRGQRSLVTAVAKKPDLMALHAISIAEVEELFPDCVYQHHSMLPWLGLTEFCVKRSWWLAETVAACRIFNAYTLSTIQWKG